MFLLFWPNSNPVVKGSTFLILKLMMIVKVKHILKKLHVSDLIQGHLVINMTVPVAGLGLAVAFRQKWPRHKKKKNENK